MDLTLQIHWDHQWHDAGVVKFHKPDLGLQGAPSFVYHTNYVVEALERFGDFEKADLADENAVGVNLPCNFHRDYLAGEIAPILRDIIPQGAARQTWVRRLGHKRDPAQQLDTQLLALGCLAPIGNLRIKEASDQFKLQAAPVPLITFDHTEIATRADALCKDISNKPHLIAGALGAGGDAPKFLLVETTDGRYVFEGTIPDTEAVRHWLVKLPRGKKSRADVQVLEGEAAIYRLLEERGFDSISGTFLDNENSAAALWLPRFDREFQSGGVVRHGLESIYSLMGVIGDGARLNHVDIIDRLRTCVTRPADPDALLVDYLARDILNTATGNRDNHGRNMALLKRGFEIELAPAFDIAPMVLDPECVAASTWWPQEFLDGTRNPDYRAILIEKADEPEAAAHLFADLLKKLVNMREGLRACGAPREMLSHRAIRMHEPERVLEELQHAFNI